MFPSPRYSSTGAHGTARHGTARHGTARHGTARHGTARHGTARHGTSRDQPGSGRQPGHGQQLVLPEQRKAGWDAGTRHRMRGGGRPVIASRTAPARLFAVAESPLQPPRASVASNRAARPQCGSEKHQTGNDRQPPRGVRDTEAEPGEPDHDGHAFPNRPLGIPTSRLKQCAAPRNAEAGDRSAIALFALRHPGRVTSQGDCVLNIRRQPAVDPVAPHPWTTGWPPARDRSRRWPSVTLSDARAKARCAVVADERAHSPRWAAAAPPGAQWLRGSDQGPADIIGISPSPVSLAEHRVLFRVGHELPDLLRAAASDGNLGSPRQRLLA